MKNPNIFLITLFLYCVCVNPLSSQEIAKEKTIDPVSFIDTDSNISIVIAPLTEVEKNVKQGKADGVFDDWESGWLSLTTKYLTKIGISLQQPIKLSSYGDQIWPDDEIIGWVPVADPNKWRDAIKMDKATWDKGELQEVSLWGTTIVRQRFNGGSLFALNRELVKSYPEKLRDAEKTLSPDEQDIVRSSGAIAQFNLGVMGRNWTDADYRSMWTESGDRADRETIDHLTNIQKSAERALVGIGYRNRELFIRSILTFKESPSTEKILQTPPKGGFSGSMGLSRDNLVSTFALNLDQFKTQSAAMVVMDGLAESNILLSEMIKLKTFALDSDYLQQHRHFLSLLFGEFYQHASSFHFGLYQRADNRRKLSVIGVINLRDVNAFHQQLQSFEQLVDLEKVEDSKRVIERLIKELSADDYTTRKSAFLKLSLIGEQAQEQLEQVRHSKDAEVAFRISKLLAAIEKDANQRATLGKNDWKDVKLLFSSVDQVEKIGKHPCHTLEIKLERAKKKQIELLNKIFGKEWNHLRRVLIGNRLIVMFGSDLEKYEEIISNVEVGRDPISELKPVARRVTSPPTLVAHGSLKTMLSLFNAEVERQDDTSERETQSLSTFSVTLDKRNWRLGLYIPGEDYQALKTFPTIESVFRRSR